MNIGCFESMQIFTTTSSRFGIDIYVHTDLTGFGSSLSTAVFLKVTLTIPNISSEIEDPISPTRPPCRIRSDRQTISLTLTTGVCEAGTKMRGASNMNIHYDVTGLLTAAWRSHSGHIVWAA